MYIARPQGLNPTKSRRSTMLKIFMSLAPRSLRVLCMSTRARIGAGELDVHVIADECEPQFMALLYSAWLCLDPAMTSASLGICHLTIRQHTRARTCLSKPLVLEAMRSFAMCQKAAVTEWAHESYRLTNTLKSAYVEGLLLVHKQRLMKL